jgi:putative transposase
MARKPRIHYPGAVYHVILRGNGGQNIFFTDSDRTRFFLLLQEGVERYGHRIHAYCLMSNHIHLAIQVADTPLSRIMQNLIFRYTRYINAQQKRTGHLFQGRYKALLIDADAYLLELVRYIHLNPVRASIVKTPKDYPWTSHHAYLGEKNIGWLTTEWVLAQFSANIKKSCRLYNDFINDGLSEGHREEFHSGQTDGRIVGEERFAKEALARTEEKYTHPISIEQVIKTVSECYGLNPRELALPDRRRKAAEARAMAACFIQEMEHLTLVELGRQFKRGISGLSQGAGRLNHRLAEDKELAAKMGKIRKGLSQKYKSQA